MKRTLSIILTVVMLLSALAVLPVSAATYTTTLPEGNKYTADTMLDQDKIPVYKSGYVLHNMDFSKVTSWTDTGYFMTTPKAPTLIDQSAGLADGALKVVTSNPMYMVMTGNQIPHNIKDFTFEVTATMRPGSESWGTNTYPHVQLGFAYRLLPNEVLTVVDNGKSGSSFVYRYGNSFPDVKASNANDSAAILKSVQEGKEVTFSFSVKDRKLVDAVAVCDGKTVTYTTTKVLELLDGAYFALYFQNINAEIKNVRVIAGARTDYTDLIWPTGKSAGDLVQTVTEDAVVPIVMEGTQTKDITGTDTYDVRFVAKIRKDAIQNATAVKFKVSASYTDTANSTPVVIPAKTLTTYKVYESIVAAGAPVEAPDGYYYAVFVLEGIQKNVNVTFNVTPGITYSEGTAIVGTLVEVTFPSAS